MKASPRTIRRPAELPDAAVELAHDHLVLRLIARSVLLAASILSFPWLRAAFLSGGGAAEFPAEIAGESKWVDDPFFLPMLISDLKRQGLINAGGRGIFLGDPSSRPRFLKKNQIEPVSANRKPAVEDRSVDFVIAAAGFKDSTFSFVDRVLRVGGVTAVRLGSDPSESFHLPSNYRMAYIRRFGSTVVAVKKISHGNMPVVIKGPRWGEGFFGSQRGKSGENFGILG